MEEPIVEEASIAAPEPRVEAPANPRPRRLKRVKREALPQLNIRVRAETIQHFYDLADQHDVTLGKMLELLLVTYSAKSMKRMVDRSTI